MCKVQILNEAILHVNAMANVDAMAHVNSSN